MSVTDELLKIKELLDKGALTQEEYEEQKAQLLKTTKPKSRFLKNLGMATAIVFVIIICISIISSFSESENSSDISNSVEQSQAAEDTTKENIPEEFAEACPVGLSGSIYDNIIGVPELKCTITNNSSKEISAVKLYFIPRDVYGEKTNSIFDANELYTDNPIEANSQEELTYQLLNSEIKSGDLYVYSVYYSDGTEWGDRTASVSIIKKHGYKIEVKY